MTTDRAETMAEVRQRANSYDGCPADIFDRALAAHDAQTARAAAVAALRTWAATVEKKLTATAAEGIDLGEWALGLRSGIQQAREAANAIEQEPRP